MSHAYIVAGLGFGDEGKGSVVDGLVDRLHVPLVVRYNGGAQAAHHVVLRDGRSHCFSQFGAGTLRGAKTFLSRFVVVEPFGMVREAAHLQDLGVPNPAGLLFVDREAVVATPFHAALNKARETARGGACHGSCGLGIGEAAAFAARFPDHALRFGDLGDTSVTSRKLAAWYESVRADWKTLRAHTFYRSPAAVPAFGEAAQMTALAEAYRDHALRVAHVVDREWLEGQEVGGPVVFEGAQGVLLDETFGFYPYTTWSTTTTANAIQLALEAGFQGRTTIGVLRSYLTRHGAGPLPTEAWGTSKPLLLAGEHNGEHPWQGDFRVGAFDVVLASYAANVTGGVDCVALTHLDKVGSPWRVCTGYERFATRQLQAAATVMKFLPQESARLAVMADWTRELASAQPIYDYADSEAVFQGIVEVAVRAPIGILSRGPTSNDKGYLRTIFSPAAGRMATLA